MFEILFPTLSIFFSFVVLFIAFSGIGLLIERAFGSRYLGIDALFLAFWVGFCAVILFLILWNFVLPVDGLALSAVLVAGGVGAYMVRRDLCVIIADCRDFLSARSYLIMILAGLWIANLATGPFESWDGGLYHLQAVKWAGTYPVVPGLANLNGAYAFNNSSFLYAAMLDSGPWRGRAFHVANGILVLAIIWQVVIAGTRFLSSGRSHADGDLFIVLLLAPAVYYTLYGRASDFNTDLPAAMVLLASASVLYRFLEGGDSGAGEGAYGIVALAVLFATIVTIKLSVGIFGVVAMFVTLALWWRAARPSDPATIRTLVWTFGVLLVFAVSWMARGVVLSGYPLFPLPIFRFPVDWAAPVEHAAALSAYIGFTEREFSWELGAGWLKILVLKDFFSVLVPSFLSLSLIAAFLFVGRADKVPLTKLFRAKSSWILLPVGVAIVSWFLVAPSPRYAVPLFWILTAVIATQGYRTLAPRLPHLGKGTILLPCIVVGLLPALIMPVKDRLFPALMEAMSPFAPVVFPGPDLGFHPIKYTPKLKEFRTSSGLVVNVPDHRLQSIAAAKCWNAPLPCTPTPAANVRLRVSGRIDRGFRVEGEWQMQDWPYFYSPRFLETWRRWRG